jgi:signal transduction histidine kinase
MDITRGIASIAAPVIENARRHRQVEQMMTVQERDRLSRELHDNLAQALSTLNLKAALADGMLSANETGPAQVTLLEMKEIIQDTYTDVREAIFNLREGGTGSPGFLPALQEYLSDYRLHYGIDAHLELECESLPEMPATVRLQLTRIIQEALTNVRKHAQVREAVVNVGIEGDWVQVCISDKGVGFDPSAIDSADRRHYGLQTMAERAESIGGSVVYDAGPKKGTRVIIRVPQEIGR